MEHPSQPDKPQDKWRLDITVAGHIFTKIFPDENVAKIAFHAVLNKAARVILWHGTSCVAAAGPNGIAPPIRGTTLGLAMLATPTAKFAKKVNSPETIAALAAASIGDLERVCHCGATFHEGMEKCPSCPGHSGAGKQLRPATVAKLNHVAKAKQAPPSIAIDLSFL